MSSRLLRGGSHEAQPAVWRPAGKPLGVPVPDPDPTPAAAAAPAPVQAPVDDSAERIAAIEREAGQRAQAAFQQGVHQGETRARQELSAKLDATVERFARSVQELSGLRQRHRREAEEDVVKLALAIARRILHRELAMDPEAILGLVKAALEKLDAREVETLRVHPENAPVLREHLDRLGLPQRLQITADPTLERGAAIFETARGSLDASAGTQLAEIERGFTDLVRHAQ